MNRRHSVFSVKYKQLNIMDQNEIRDLKNRVGRLSDQRTYNANRIKMLERELEQQTHYLRFVLVRLQNEITELREENKGLKEKNETQVRTIKRLKNRGRRVPSNRKIKK